MIEAGLKGSAEVTVARGNTAMEVGSGSVEVFATPMLVALLENAAINALKGKLPEGSTTVGMEIAVKHLAATPVGLVVKGEAFLEEVDGRRLIFRVEAHDSVEKVGEGRHVRFILNQEKFMEKALQKTQKES